MSKLVWTNIPITNGDGVYKTPPTDNLDERRRNDLVITLNLVASEGSTKAISHLAIIRHLKDQLDTALEEAEEWTISNVSRTIHSAVASSRSKWDHMFRNTGG